MSKAEPEKDWKAGHHCRAIFSEDSCEYEATIIEILKDENAVPYAEVEFVGYLDREFCWMEQLMESKGEEARKKQVEDAGMEVTTGTDAIENSDQVDHVDQNKIEPTKPPVEKVSASDGIPIILEKKVDQVDHMGDNKIEVIKPPMEKEAVSNKIEATKAPMEKVPVSNGIPSNLEKKDDAKTSEVCVKVETSGKKALFGEFNDLKKYIVKIEEKADGIISEYQQKNKALGYELKKSKDMQETQKICEDVLRDAQDGMIVKHAQQNEEIKKQNEEIKRQNEQIKKQTEQIKNMKNEMDVFKSQLENKVNEGIDETDANNNASKTVEGQKAQAKTNADPATAQMGITSEELKNQTVKAMKFASREVFPGMSMRALSDAFFEEVYQKFLDEVKSENI